MKQKCLSRGGANSTGSTRRVLMSADTMGGTRRVTGRPYFSAKATEEMSSSGIKTATSWPTRCALVVDDEWLLVEYARTILEELGCEVVTAICGIDALHALAVNERIDLLIT